MNDLWRFFVHVKWSFYVWHNTIVLTFDLSEECRNVFVIKGQSSTEQSIQDDTTRPNVHFRPSVKFPRNNFWSGVIGRATTGAQKFTICHHIRKAEICNFDIQILIQKQVFRFQISMNDIVTVAVFYTRHDLLEKSPSFVFCQLKINRIFFRLHSFMNRILSEISFFPTTIFFPWKHSENKAKAKPFLSLITTKAFPEL